MKNNKHTSLWTKDFIIITIINLLIFTSFQMLLPVMPVYIKDLGASDSVIGWITGLTTISALLIRPLSGIGLDRIGRRGIFFTGLLIIILITLAYGFVPVIGVILTLRFIHGFGWGMASTASTTIASDSIPKKRFGEGMGFFSLSSSLAMAIAPSIGLSVFAGLNFKAASLLATILSVFALILSFGLKYKKVEKIQSPKAKVTLFEKSSIAPSIVVFFVAITYGSIIGFISLYAKEQGIENIGLFFAVYAISLLITRPIFGKLVDSYGFNLTIIPGFVFLIIAMLFLSNAHSLLIFLISGLLYGIGFGAVQSTLQTMAVIKAPRDRTGSANATFFTGFDAGIGFGSVIAGIIASSIGYSGMYLWSIVSIVIAGFLYFLILKNKVPTKTNI